MVKNKRTGLMQKGRSKQMFHNWFILWCMVVSHALLGQQFSDSVRISLITGSPGKDLYAQFGHSAIRVQDLRYDQDYVFNYGTFDFDTPNFYLKFIRGKLDYVLSVGYTARMIPYYEQENRRLIDQELLLSEQEKQKLIDFLRFNYLPENRAYRYDFFYDNCATRIRDIFENELHLTYRKSKQDSLTFRQMLDLYIKATPWIDFGMDLILGMPTDQKGGMREQMFLPEYLANNLSQYALKNGQPLLAAPVEITHLTPNPPTSFLLLTPMVVMVALFLSIVALTWLGSPKVKFQFDRIFFTLLGLIGCFFLFMWFGTDHWTVNQNLNMLWANPLFLAVAFVMKNKGLTKILLSILSALCLLVLLGWNWLPQQFHIAIIPIVVSILVRCADRWLKN